MCVYFCVVCSFLFSFFFSRSYLHVCIYCMGSVPDFKINRWMVYRIPRVARSYWELCVGYNYVATAIRRRTTVQQPSNRVEWSRAAFKSKSNRSCNQRLTGAGVLFRQRAICRRIPPAKRINWSEIGKRRRRPDFSDHLCACV